MLPDLRTAGFRCQWTAAWLNVVPSCQGETHPVTGETNQQDVQDTWGQSHVEVRGST